ncbi:MAG: TfoX/Sxy family protein, partial [Actinobacteria bacterium]|nr:TfoX/Sxy family protein [Actinomycetota bacterium]
GDLLRDVPELTTRAMFGGHGVYSRGAIVAIVIDGVLYLKADEALAEELAALGSEQFVYTRKDGRSAAMKYWTFPEDAIESPAAAAAWIERAYAVSTA